MRTGTFLSVGEDEWGREGFVVQLGCLGQEISFEKGYSPRQKDPCLGLQRRV